MKFNFLTSLLLMLPAIFAANTVSNGLFIDARYTPAKGEPSWLDGQLGKTRYGAGLNGRTASDMHISETSLITTWEPSWDLEGFLHLKNTPEQRNAVNLMEVYFKYQPAPN
ncbi:MAG: hypothetical protein JKX83_08195 [Pseudomonadales bacterium]|nr:hypothetical protein [Pseudomonadales bacterium]